MINRLGPGHGVAAAVEGLAAGAVPGVKDLPLGEMVADVEHVSFGIGLVGQQVRVLADKSGHLAGQVARSITYMAKRSD